MPKIFISYRQSESSAITRLIYNDLSLQFGEDNIFRDIEKIRIGKDIKEEIEKAIIASDVLVIVIGKTWLKTLKERIESGDIDLLRFEVETGLHRASSNAITLIPILVDDAKPPRKDELPKSVQGLSGLLALKVRSGGDYNNDMKRLISTIEASVPHASAKIEEPDTPKHEEFPITSTHSTRKSVKSGNIGLIIGGIVSFLIIIILGIIALQGDGNLSNSDQTETAQAETQADLDIELTQTHVAMLALSEEATENLIPTDTEEPIATLTSAEPPATSISEEPTNTPQSPTPQPQSLSDLPVLTIRWDTRFLAIENRDTDFFDIRSLELRAQNDDNEVITISGTDWASVFGVTLLRPTSCLLLFNAVSVGGLSLSDMLAQINVPACQLRYDGSSIESLLRTSIDMDEVVWAFDESTGFDVLIDGTFVQTCVGESNRCEIYSDDSNPTVETVTIEAVWNERALTLRNTSDIPISLSEMRIIGQSTDTEFDAVVVENGASLRLNAGSCLLAYPLGINEPPSPSTNCQSPYARWYQLGSSRIFWTDSEGFIVMIEGIISTCSSNDNVCDIRVPID